MSIIGKKTTGVQIDARTPVRPRSSCRPGRLGPVAHPRSPVVQISCARLQTPSTTTPPSRPPTVRRWVNLADPGDLIAVPRVLSRYFTGIDTDLEPSIHAFDFHKAKNYLANPPPPPSCTPSYTTNQALDTRSQRLGIRARPCRPKRAPQPAPHIGPDKPGQELPCQQFPSLPVNQRGRTIVRGCSMVQQNPYNRCQGACKRHGDRRLQRIPRPQFLPEPFIFLKSLRFLPYPRFRRCPALASPLAR